MSDQRAEIIRGRLEVLRHAIDEWCRHYGRQPAAVRLLAVSKTFPASDVAAAAAAGQRAFGESYLKEALEKIAALRHLPLEWHFIGPLQSNKTRLIAEHFDWVQSLDRLKLAERLSAQRPADRAPLNVLLQVNISGEASKSGVALPELPALAEAVRRLPRLRLRGLMAIPAPSRDFGAQRTAFRALHQAYRMLQEKGLALDTLSMGMSADLEAAIAEGSTLLRVGTGIFGPRRPKTG
ncbi:YggS family pyridoxal phosphate-dependent enzyme [Thiohalobacter sp. IOR34]|uniref:YggS family pyridoxal phosphate-dependent enzyme n=1 Tax=Thiohalobacter sp. IOR34 TaxID=3057176 RepID=UPI0025B2138C|nr:YggS family pyridoxal phosphate-dependent enzyme [Thiohalobacter sp. IOR34]WJW75778.1 YggS family pyridoxal phosphate-dependent enzyme [Thiohalobacter sp. IOR34]